MAYSPTQRVKKLCYECGGENVKADAWAAWNERSQDWELADTFDAEHCDDCEGETHIVDVPLSDVSISINAEQKLYVMTTLYGTSCYGFDVLERKGNAIAKWLAEMPYDHLSRLAMKLWKDTAESPATIERYRAFEVLCAAGAAIFRVYKKRCDAELIPQFIGHEGERVEVQTPDGEKRRFYIGKSMGWIPCHLEIANSRSIGGGGVYFPEGSRVKFLGKRR